MTPLGRTLGYLLMLTIIVGAMGAAGWIERNL